MFWARPAAAFASLLLLGPVVDPHAHDPYHAHWSLTGGKLPASWNLASPHPGQPPGSGHAAGVVWLRGADPSGPAALHVGALVAASAPRTVWTVPDAYPRPPWLPQTSSTPVDLDPEDPPPRAC